MDVTNNILRTVVDKNQDVFRYGLNKFDDSNYEDPTYLGFTLEIDSNSALFTDVLPFLEKYSSKYPELKARIPVYKEFLNRVKQIFNSQDSVNNEQDKTQFIKQHYINSVSGLDNLKKKFVEWREDKLTIELYEDIALFSSYLAYLYNNLVYSYENGRNLIPENLLKFNLYIRISEIRNLTSVGKLNSNDISDRRIVDALKNNVTCIVYKLYDCEFDFFNSSPMPDQIVQSGIDASYPGQAVLELDIYFKSVSRQIFNPLIKNSLAMNDNKVDLDVIIVNSSGQPNPSGTQLNPSQTVNNSDGSLYQKENVQSVAVYKQEAFTNSINKKPSSLNTYDSEVLRNSEIAEQNDFKTKEKIINDIISHNDELSSTTIQNIQNNIPTDDVVNNDIINANVNGDNNNRIINSPNILVQEKFAAQKTINDKRLDLQNNINKNINKTIQEERNRNITKLKQYRNELVRNFIFDLSETVGLKKIIPANVYDNDYYQNLLDSFKKDVGGPIAGGIIGLITNN